MGGIGKTSIALTVLHNGRIKKRFGDDRRFIRCDQFPASLPHFCRLLSKVIGAGVENPDGLTPLRPFLSSKEMLIVLDNVESILDSRGPNSRELYSAIDELSLFSNICLCITSRISTIPPNYETIEVPILSTEAARRTFYRIYRSGEESDSVNNILEKLEFHPLSITLLATVAHQSRWGIDQLTMEWERRRTGVLHTAHNKTLSATIELSLTSPMFEGLGSDARKILGIVAFFPQGVDERNLDWLFPTTPSRDNIFDKFCVLSLAYRNNGFVTMLAPIRDYLGPPDPPSSPLLCATRDRYFNRLSVDVDPDKPGFGETQWIKSEDVNVEHLLDVFTSVDPNMDDIWNVGFHFMRHLYWHRPRQTLLGSKIEALPDDHPFKPKCLCELSRLFDEMGNYAEQKRLLTYTLELERQRGNDSAVAQTLKYLSSVNRQLLLREEGIQQAKEALEIYERINDTKERTQCLNKLAWLFLDDKQFDAAENAASRAIDLVTEKDQEYLVCAPHRVLGSVHRSKGEKEKAIHHFETALEIASPQNWGDVMFWTHLDLARLFHAEYEFYDANAHIERAKSHTADEPFKLGHAMYLQAAVWNRQRKYEDARLEALNALDIFEKLGATPWVGSCRELLQIVEGALRKSAY